MAPVLLAARPSSSSSVPVVLQAAVTDASCPSLAYMQPRLTFAVPDGSMSLSPMGLMLGPGNTAATGAGIHSLQQDSVAFANAAVPGHIRQLLANLPAASSTSGAIRLPGNVDVALQP